MARGISRKHALNEGEFTFVRIYSAFGCKNAAEAYRRAFCTQDDDGNWFEKDRAGDPRANKPVTPKEASRRALQLLEQDYIQGFLTELDQGAGDSARTLLGDAILLTNDATALKAAEKVLADEDKLGFRDAVEKWAEILCAIGTEVVVPLPGGGEAIVDMRSMFPTYADALPPRDVIEKTIKSLEEYRAELDAAAAGADPR